MKKQIFASILLSGLVLTIGSGSSSAATTTEGKASFETEEESNWETVKPNPDPSAPSEVVKPDRPITPEVVNKVSLLYAPQFDFGTNKISLSDKTYNAIYDSVKDSSATSYAIPHFVQVGDASGSLGTQWEVTVNQTADFTSSSGNTLKNTTIDLYGATLTNDSKDAGTALSGLTIASGSKSSIPVGSGTLSILKRKDATKESATTGSISSVVFQDNYNPDDYTVGSTVASIGDRTSAVKLNVPKQQVVADSYTADLVWTLSVTP